jgi:hypothetical protein
MLLNPLWAGDRSESSNWIKIGWSNDIFFQTDQYFTNGMNLTYYNRRMGNTFLKYIHLPDGKDSQSFYGIALQQDIFTPGDLHSTQGLSQDRPYASYLLINSIKIQTNNIKKLVIKSALEVGVLGEYGGGEWVQNGIHNLLPASSYVNGWANQIQSDIILNYGIKLEKGLINQKKFSVSGTLLGKIGSPYTYAGVGVNFRAGDISNYFKDLGFAPIRGLQYYLFTNLSGKLVAHNATIEGGLLNRRQEITHPDIEPVVYELKSGFNFSINRFQMEIGVKLISPEFKSGLSHRWGYLSFMFAL